MLDLIGCGPENFRRELHRMCVAAIRIGADTDATCTVSFASISINNEEAKTSSNRATFITKSRPGGQAMVPWADATPRNGMRSTGKERPSFDSAKINRCCAREAQNSFVASSRSFRSSNCALLSTAIPKSISRVARPGRSP